MARNWKPGEAVEIIKKGKDLESIQDIGKRFPLFLMCAAQANEATQKLLSAIPEMISVRQLESRLRGEDEGEDKEEETPKKKPTEDEEAPKKKSTEEAQAPKKIPRTEEELLELPTKTLAAICAKLELNIKETYLTSKKYMTKVILAYFAEDDEEEEKPAKKSAKKPAEDDDEEEEKPKKKKPAKEDDDDDEDPAPKKKKPAEDDDDEEEKPKKKAPKEDDWDI